MIGLPGREADLALAQDRATHWLMACLLCLTTSIVTGTVLFPFPFYPEASRLSRLVARFAVATVLSLALPVLIGFVGFSILCSSIAMSWPIDPLEEAFHSLPRSLSVIADFNVRMALLPNNLVYEQPPEMSREELDAEFASNDPERILRRTDCSLLHRTPGVGSREVLQICNTSR
jgi:hypothetical protein